MRVVFDIETSGLLNEWLDYSQYPFRLKEGFKIHCLCAKDVDTGKKYEFYGDTIKDIPEFFSSVDYVITHNGIGFDLRVLQLFFNIDFDIGPDRFVGGCYVDDTLVLSRVLYPDRKGGHSLKAWGKRLGILKGDFSENTDWKDFSEDMLRYCRQDVEVNEAAWKALWKEAEGWDWTSAYELEKSTQYITTIQEHFGFNFDTELARKSHAELSKWLQEIEQKVEPQLPPKPMGKTAGKKFTPPKVQFKKDGSLNANLIKFVEKHKGKVKDNRSVELYGVVHTLPLKQEPVIDHEPMTLANQADLKKWLVSAGWNPKVWSEKDLTLNNKKQKLTPDEFRDSVLRYVEGTIGSPYEKYRCMHVKSKPYELKRKLLNHDINRPLKVYTSPKYTINQDKDVDPSLEKLGDKYAFIKDVVKWLTYRHRRSSILSEKGAGFLMGVRSDGRISTPANSCGTPTSRYQHKVVCNIPRVTSLYGEPLRRSFGCSEGNWQVGYDAAGLEARIEGHYTKQFKGGKEYAKALVADKPNDIHTVSAKKNGVTRDEQKTLKYAISYGAQANKIAAQMGWSLARAKRVFEAFWETAEPLKILKERVTQYWKTKGGKKFVRGLDGRKLWVRSQHSILNIIFQSAGVICCKKANKLHWDALKERGLLFNPFVDSSINGKCMIMIHYHDEAQWEVSKELVQRWEFDDLESAENKVRKLLTEGKTCGNIDSHGGKHVVSYSVVGDLARKCMKEAGRHYNLRVELDSDYSVGKNWAECH